jgi:hypothetical protein
MPRESEQPPASIDCGSGFKWEFVATAVTAGEVDEWRADRQADDLVETLTKKVTAAGEEWQKKVQCTGKCHGSAHCEKGKVSVGPAYPNGPPWVHSKKADSANLYVTVTATYRCAVACYCRQGKLSERPDWKEGKTAIDA